MRVIIIIQRKFIVMENNFNVAAQSASSVTTNKVLRNTYALLGVSLFPTVIGALL